MKKENDTEMQSHKRIDKKTKMKVEKSIAKKIVRIRILRDILLYYQRKIPNIRFWFFNHIKISTLYINCLWSKLVYTIRKKKRILLPNCGGILSLNSSQVHNGKKEKRKRISDNRFACICIPFPRSKSHHCKSNTIRKKCLTT